MISPEMEQHFTKRTNYHIDLVRNNIQHFINNWYYPYGLRERALRHDKSKFEEPEKIGYIYRTWQSHCIFNNIDFSPPEEIIEKSVNHHLKNNSHHPEFHGCPDDMSDMDMIEMVCDWFAMGQEFGEKSIRPFADKVLANKYKFNSENLKKIHSYIDLLERFSHGY